MRQTITLTIMALLYLLFSVRYFPGQPGESLLATLYHLLQSLPLLVAATYLVVLVVRRVTGQGPSRFGIARIFLTIGLGYEFIFALHHYTTAAAG